MTTADHIAVAVSALDESRRALETLVASPCGDADVDDTISEALAGIEAQIGALHAFATECAR